MIPTKTLYIHYGKGNTLIISCNEVVIVEINDEFSYKLNPFENPEHLHYIETLYEWKLISEKLHGENYTIFKLFSGGQIYDLKTSCEFVIKDGESLKVIYLGKYIQQEDNKKLLVVDIKNNRETAYIYENYLQLVEVL